MQIYLNNINEHIINVMRDRLANIVVGEFVHQLDRITYCTIHNRMRMGSDFHNNLPYRNDHL